MNKLIKLLAAFLMITTITLSAQDDLDSYYINLGLGFSGTSYNSNYVETLKDVNYGGDSIFVDFGIYFPINDHFLFGGALTVVNDSFDDDSKYKYTDINYTTSLLGISSIYFQNYMEEGFFVRGDLGLTSLTVTYNDDTNDFYTKEDRTNDEMGLGFVLGIGYAVPLNLITVTTSLLYSYKSINDSTHNKSIDISTISLSVNALF